MNICYSERTMWRSYTVAETRGIVFCAVCMCLCLYVFVSVTFAVTLLSYKSHAQSHPSHIHTHSHTHTHTHTLSLSIHLISLVFLHAVIGMVLAICNGGSWPSFAGSSEPQSRPLSPAEAKENLLMEQDFLSHLRNIGNLAGASGL
jgi:hypothetical protein